MKTIASRDNPLYKRLRAVAGDARVRERERVALLEGDHLIRAWLAARRPVLACVVVEDAGEPAEVCARRAEAGGADVARVPRTWLRALSGLDTPPQVLALVEQRQASVADIAGRDCIAFDRVQDPGNVGAMLRTAAAAGVTAAIAGPGCAGLWSPKVVRAAMGAHVHLALVETDDLAAALESLGVTSIGTTLDATEALHAADLRSPCVWVFGHEGQGIDAALAARLDRRVRIAQSDAVESLNVAAAAAVCLFEMRRQRGEVDRVARLC